MLISSGTFVAAAAVATTDSWTNRPLVIAAVALVRLEAVGSAIILPPERIFPKTLSRCSAKTPALERRRGTASRRSAGDGRKEVTFASAEGDRSILTSKAEGLETRDLAAEMRLVSDGRISSAGDGKEVRDRF
jgi:hypothetical protein